MIPKLVFDQAVRDASILDYLNSMGSFATQDDGAIKKFKCPIHEDDTPSFYVYPKTEDKLENFHCYGCKAGGTIINLISMMENISIGKAIKKIVKDVDYDENEALAYTIENMKKVEKRAGRCSPEELSWTVSLLCNRGLRAVKFTEPYRSRIERALQYFDSCLQRYDMEQANEIYQNLLEIIPEQMAVYEEQDEKERMETVRIYSGIR